MRIAALQINPLIGAVAQNFQKLEGLMRQNLKDPIRKADLFVCPELALTGYPPRDLLSIDSVIEAEAIYLEKIKELSAELGIGILIGHSQRNDTGVGKPLFNCASFFDSGNLLGCIHKTRLAEYNVFEESRFFEPANKQYEPITFRQIPIGVSICEDSWDTVLAFGRQDVRRYPLHTNPIHSHKGASIEINLSASPFVVGKHETRKDLLQASALRHQKLFVYCTCVGGQDDIIFDGGSMAFNKQGELIAECQRFHEDILVVEIGKNYSPLPRDLVPNHGYLEILEALILGIRDYAHKNKFRTAALGISGGIDSALCAYLACRALGSENVFGFYLPSQFSSQESKTLSQKLCASLKMSLSEISIDEAVESCRISLKLESRGLAYENLQSRMRGIFLMAQSNSKGHLLLTTGNKSELAMGYGTLYGDMCGGLNPLGDLFKTEVFALCHLINSKAFESQSPHPIPEEIILRVPSAELAPNQKDTDSLPPYEILDLILEDLIENGERMRFKRYDTLLGSQHSLHSIKEKFHSQEFKRYQAPPILRVKNRAFGSGWHMPLTRGSV